MHTECFAKFHMKTAGDALTSTDCLNITGSTGPSYVVLSKLKTHNLRTKSFINFSGQRCAEADAAE